MCKRVLLVMLAAALVCNTACPPNSGPNGTDNPDNSLVARSWPEAYGNTENTGFNFVHSQFALPPFVAWSADVGSFAPVSPVIGPDGVIWVANANGELVGFNPDGTQHRRRKLDDLIVSTPAINPATNEIFVVGEQPGPNGYTSHIYRLDAGAGLLNVSDTPIKTGAAPKLWDHFLFLATSGAVTAFDQTSLTQLGRGNAIVCFNLVCGINDPNGSVIDEIIDATLACVLTAGQSGTCPDPIYHSVNLAAPFTAPTVAIIDNPNVLPDGDVSKPIVVVVSTVCAVGYRFHPNGDAPTGPNLDPYFELIWSHALVEVDCDFKSVRSNTPIVAGGDAVVIADETGRVIELDAVTGALRWEQHLSESINSPPVTNTLREIYVLETSHLATLDSNGAMMSEVPLNGLTLAGAVSIDFIYAGTTQGIYSIDGGGQQSFARTPVNGAATGIAIAPDGTVYVTAPSIDPNAASGLLVAYSTRSSIAAQVVFPTAQWQTPADGATIVTSAGQDLRVALAGPGGGEFQGTASFESDLDGALCINVSPSGGTATCTTSKALSIGTHKLTAFATDPSGGTQSASITVQVIAPPPAANTPPTVAITSPANNAVFKQAATISFSALVTDPDQASFDASAIQWQSSIDGAIGTGLSFSKTLSLGQHTITCKATDMAGATGSASIAVEVTPGPVVTIQSPAENSSHSDIETITFTATVVDVDQPTFPGAQVHWTSDISGELGTGLTLLHKLAIGHHTITATATDVNGFEGTATVHVAVVGN